MIGCGGVGLSAVQVAVACGARVVAVDPSPGARDLATAMGAEHVLPTADGIVELRDRLLGSDFRSRTFEEAESIWIGILVDPDLAEDAQILQVSDQLVRIRSLLPTSG